MKPDFTIPAEFTIKTQTAANGAPVLFWYRNQRSTRINLVAIFAAILGLVRSSLIPIT